MYHTKKNQYKKAMVRKISTFTVVFLLFICTVSFGGETVIKIGIASPQSKSEENNIELLRQRSLRNAMDLAVQQTSGMTISSERGDSIRSRQNTVIQDGQVIEEGRQQSRYRSAATSRSEGHARVVEIIKEWQDKGQYFIKAKIEVESTEELIRRKNAGYFWRQAGAPSLALHFQEEYNGEIHENLNDHTLRFLRDNLVRNDLEISTALNPQYRINVLQTLKARTMTDFDTTTMHCRLSFQIVDMEKKETVAEYRASHGPDAGFSIEQAEKSCLGAISPEVSEKLVRKIAEIMSQRWNNGLEYLIVIDSMPGDAVIRVNEILQNLYRVTMSAPSRFSNERYEKKITFKGNGDELAEAIRISLEDEDWSIRIDLIENSRVQLTWAGPLK